MTQIRKALKYEGNKSVEESGLKTVEDRNGNRSQQIQMDKRTGKLCH